MGLFDKIKSGLSKSSNKISSSINNIFIKKKLDQETLDSLEELLISSDMGLEATEQILQDFAKEKFDKEISPQEVKIFLAEKIAQILECHNYQESEIKGTKVILVCGVNGNGKTTSIGKLAYKYQTQDKSVMMAACDTFRAAAVDQLKIWGQRNNCPVITGPENSDPASVAYKAYQEAIKNNIDILLIDTAGRLHNKANLMAELGKISRVLQKINPEVPHETILVVDATTGQNAHNQLEKFNEIIKITSLIITKLDGTAKAGVAVALVNKYHIPIKAIGVGEQLNDLNDFDSKIFAENLIGL